MSMNRETKRMLQRQGQLGPDGEVARTPRQPQQRPAPRSETERTTPRKYLREVRAELMKVVWPTREEVIRYSTIVLLTLVVLTTLIFVLDYAFAKGILALFDQ
jgi:preprotein translocase subunit SecE